MASDAEKVPQPVTIRINVPDHRTWTIDELTSGPSDRKRRWENRKRKRDARRRFARKAARG